MSETPKVRDVEHAMKMIGDLFGFTPEWCATFAVDVDQLRAAAV
jgi:hypothetical protein